MPSHDGSKLSSGSLSFQNERKTRIIHGFQVGQRELLKNHLPNPKSDFCDLNNRKSPVAPSQKGIVSL
ncbi:MAG: hypothetical protein IJT60_05555, partial [Clostridia bacterium]|nr:hypothetical protein [Clostridia bacterium]